MRICVFGAASPTIDKDYIEKVETLGKMISRRGHSLTYGGGCNGLMGAAARGVRAEGGYILGVAPKFFFEDSVEVIFTECDELMMPDTMRERKQIMEDNADAFIITPGGIGTFEEFFEILTSKQLCRHNKPIAIYNINGYYNEIQGVMESAIKKNFVKEQCLSLYKVTEDLDELFDYIEKPVDDNLTIQDLKEG